ncbi:molybdopterin synthase catalytic subunit [Fontimonas thermophila]|uniref:Molybdopterin synthase catalytic subunit n=1 Tax=Fontimonas thermophila TaxID=1076937 RepID=A0A1I2H574_9GAMM|nr:molybdenum cofactor biosynthesis protein MoaE [Fontimonas thermophila]SFF24127.1 molybdopterin synthase catalytic subunit [Fontimonas thermophila]
MDDLAFDAPRIQERPLVLDELLVPARDDCGALAIFAGTVRNHHDGKPVTHLIYTAHVRLADKMIRAIEQEIGMRHGVPLCRVVHRIGRLAIGEVAIYAVVRAPHRAEAFAALRAAVDAVKHRVPIWKEEFYADGTSAFVTGCCIAEPEAAAHGDAHHSHSH